MFVASDVAKALGYSRPADAITAHCKGSVKHRLPTNGGMQELKIIPEGDVYRLITHSKLPAAEKFESWVFDEFLPSIRKHGAYMTVDIPREDGTTKVVMNTKWTQKGRLFLYETLKKRNLLPLIERKEQE